MRTIRMILAGSVAMPIVICLAPSVLAQPATAARPATAAPPSPSAPAPDAMQAVSRMSDYLRTLKGFVVNADVTTEQVLESGQKVQFGGRVQIQARRPDRFKVSMDTALQDRDLYYDGKTMTIFAPKIGYYASIPAPATIGATLDIAKTKYGIEIPLADLFTWGADPSLAARVKSGFDVGLDTVDGQPCEHYAFRQDKVDWQLWIRQGDAPLPCKLVITTREDPAMPQYVAVLKWDTATSAPEETYVFKPPADAHKIDVAEASGQVKPATAQAK